MDETHKKTKGGAFCVTEKDKKEARTLVSQKKPRTLVSQKSRTLVSQKKPRTLVSQKKSRTLVSQKKSRAPVPQQGNHTWTVTVFIITCALVAYGYHSAEITRLEHEHKTHEADREFMFKQEQIKLKQGEQELEKEKLRILTENNEKQEKLEKEKLRIEAKDKDNQEKLEKEKLRIEAKDKENQREVILTKLKNDKEIALETLQIEKRRAELETRFKCESAEMDHRAGLMKKAMEPIKVEPGSLSITFAGFKISVGPVQAQIIPLDELLTDEIKLKRFMKLLTNRHLKNV